MEGGQGECFSFKIPLDTPWNNPQASKGKNKRCATPPGSPPGTSPLASGGTGMCWAVGGERHWVPGMLSPSIT